MTEKIEITDRYQALGIPYPDPETCCPGQCEGIGVIPIWMNFGDGTKPDVYPEEETDPVFIKLWKEAEEKEPTTDGYHFVECPTCKGTGKKL